MIWSATAIPGRSTATGSGLWDITAAQRNCDEVLCGGVPTRATTTNRGPRTRPPPAQDASPYDIDGPGRFATYWRIGLPLARPALGAVAIFTFLHRWTSSSSRSCPLHSRQFTIPQALTQFVDATAARCGTSNSPLPRLRRSRSWSYSSSPNASSSRDSPTQGSRADTFGRRTKCQPSSRGTDAVRASSPVGAMAAVPGVEQRERERLGLGSSGYAVTHWQGTSNSVIRPIEARRADALDGERAT